MIRTSESNRAVTISSRTVLSIPLRSRSDGGDRRCAGFSDASHFVKVVRRHTGQTPLRNSISLRISRDSGDVSGDGGARDEPRPLARARGAPGNTDVATTEPLTGSAGHRDLSRRRPPGRASRPLRPRGIHGIDEPQFAARAASVVVDIRGSGLLREKLPSGSAPRTGTSTHNSPIASWERATPSPRAHSTRSGSAQRMTPFSCWGKKPKFAAAPPRYTILRTCAALRLNAKPFSSVGITLEVLSSPMP